MNAVLYRPKPDVISTDLDDESVLLDLNTRRYYALNDTGTRVWQLLEKGLQLPSIADAITQEWDVDLDEAEQTVHALLEDLAKEGLVERVSP